MAINEITKVSETLFIGSFDHPLKLTESFKQLGIEAIVNCCTEIRYSGDSYINVYIAEHLPFEQFNILINGCQGRYIVINFQFSKNTETLFQNRTELNDGIDDIDDFMEKISFLMDLDMKLYFHCIDGNTISPAVLMYVMMMKQGGCFVDVFDSLMVLRQSITINDSLVSELRVLNDCNRLISDEYSTLRSVDEYSPKLVTYGCNDFDEFGMIRPEAADVYKKYDN